MRTLAFLLLLLLGSTAALAEDEPKKPAAPPPKPLTASQAVDVVLKAVKAKDGASLETLAEKDDPDPWLVANLLCYRGEHDAAAALAKAAPRPDTEKLPAYVEARRKREPDKAGHELIRTMIAAMSARQPQRVVDGTAALAQALDPLLRVRLLHLRGAALLALTRRDESRGALRQAVDGALALGWLQRAQLLTQVMGASARQGSDFAHALASFEEGLALARRRGHKPEMAGRLVNIGTVYYSLEAFSKALSFFERGLDLAEEIGHRQFAVIALYNIGNVYLALEDYAMALSTYEQARARQEALGDKHGAATTLGYIGRVYVSLGDFAKALSTKEQARAQMEALGDKAGAARTLGDIGSVYAKLGDYAKALSTYEQARARQEALWDKAGAAATLGNIGAVYAELGDFAKALSIHEQALAQKEALGDRHGAAATLGNIGNAYLALEDYAKALSTHERALAQKEALGHKAGAAHTLGNIGYVHWSLGDYAKALSIYEQALAQQEALGNKDGAAETLRSIGDAYRSLGDFAKARGFLERSARAAKSLRATPLLVSALTTLARIRLDAGNPSGALTAAREALGEVGGMLRGLGDEQGATAREQYAELFAIGTVAATREKNTAEVLSFLEHGRAGALLDALGHREVLRWKADSLPPDLRRLDLQAQAAESNARHVYDLALKRQNLPETRAASKALDEASDAVRAVVGRIQRELKQQANLFYPVAKKIGEIESALEEDQALVLYGLCLDEALALVLRRDGERVVSLGKIGEVTAACEALHAADINVDPKAALDTLRKLLVEPLNLEVDVKQVLVSPEGPLCYMPFSALFDQTVAMTPSGTTHLLLLDEERGQGDGVLALGDPDYAGASKAAGAIYYRGRTLSALPATRNEVETIGTQTLLGAKASEAGLKEALPTSKRWRGVHFACHGLVDIDRPMLSSLALSRAGDDDGFLTALEILRMKIPADLAVLSACETATGRIVAGEGIVGLTRAFMFAGAPRVICSLWKVDDEATQALMIEFYRLWNPKEGKGLGAAAALKQAQAFVRDHPNGKWKLPYYWAAWVLWGLPQ